MAARRLFNFEGVTPEGVARVEAAQAAREGAAGPRIVFLRDPLNTVASLIRRKRWPAMDIVMLCQQLFALEVWLRDRAAPAAGALHLGYDSWLLDPDYRAGAAARLGIADTPPPEAVTPHGGGSSFGGEDRLDAAGRAERLRRWPAFRDHPVFNALVGHASVRETFEAACAGDLEDGLGAGFRDEDAALHLHRLRAGRAPVSGFADRAIARLRARRSIYGDIESVSGLAKKRHLLRATLTALV